MEQDFISWWFENHWILSTFFSPGFALAWAVWKGATVRAVVACGMLASNVALRVLVEFFKKRG